MNRGLPDHVVHQILVKYFQYREMILTCVEKMLFLHYNLSLSFFDSLTELTSIDSKSMQVTFIYTHFFLQKPLLFLSCLLNPSFYHHTAGTFWVLCVVYFFKLECGKKCEIGKQRKSGYGNSNCFLSGMSTSTLERVFFKNEEEEERMVCALLAKYTLPLSFSTSCALC